MRTTTVGHALDTNHDGCASELFSSVVDSVGVAEEEMRGEEGQAPTDEVEEQVDLSVANIANVDKKEQEIFEGFGDENNA